MTYDITNRQTDKQPTNGRSFALDRRAELLTMALLAYSIVVFRAEGKDHGDLAAFHDHDIVVGYSAANDHRDHQPWLRPHENIYCIFVMCIW